MTTAHLILSNARVLQANGKVLANQSVAIKEGKIIWCGDSNQLPESLLQKDYLHQDCHNDLLTPGFIDCHTHLVYGGHRAHEFSRRLAGESYQMIAASGGGIRYTVQQTRQATFEELIAASLPRVKALKNTGVTTLEVKSGYGLDFDTEVKMLKVARSLEKLSGVRIRTSFLGAHGFPDEFKSDKKGYIRFLCEEMIPFIAKNKLADAIDVFCEHLAFDLQQTEQIFASAKANGLPIKCHAEQLSNMGASYLAAQYQALSCDHLEFLDEKAAMEMAKNNTIAVLLPGAYYFTGEKQKPPIELLRTAGVKMAVASDANPGTSPIYSMLDIMNMACCLFSLTTQEALQAVTVHAAQALDLAHEVGRIAPGFIADLILWSIDDADLLCYYLGFPLEHRLMIAGQWVNE